MEITEILNDVVAHCKIRQHYEPAPITFKAYVPAERDLAFGDEIPVDLLFLDGSPVLHGVEPPQDFLWIPFWMLMEVIMNDSQKVCV